MFQSRYLAVLTLILGLSMAIGCASDDKKGPQAQAQPVEREQPRPILPYEGPRELQMTIDSLVTVSGMRPVLVSGYGIMVNLPGTGSADMPPTLRAEMITMARRNGVQRPESLLGSRNTAVVLVRGFVPPGATPGTRFDLYVEAIPQSETVSIVDGDLWTTDLAILGENLAFGRPVGFTVAQGNGPLFANPFVSVDPNATNQNPRAGMIIGGGVVQKTAKISLTLREASYERSRLIAQRINGRFPQDPQDRFPMAVPKTDTTIEINVLNRFKDDPEYMMNMILGLYLNPTQTYNAQKAIDLKKFLAKPQNQDFAPVVSLAWQGMGRSHNAYFRSLYNDSNKVVQMTSLSVGSSFGDALAAEPLYKIAMNARLDDRRGEIAATLLSTLYVQSDLNPRIEQMLVRLLNHDDALIRYHALDGLLNSDSPLIQKRVLPNKFELILVPSQKPLIFVTQKMKPRIIVFDSQMPINTPVFHSLWKDRLMMNATEVDSPLNIRFKAFATRDATVTRIAPYVGNLIMLLAAPRDDSFVVKGFDLKYSQVCAALYDLSRSKVIDAPFVLQQSNIITEINDESGREDTDGERPNFE